jgi:hypothetical protein
LISTEDHDTPVGTACIDITHPRFDDAVEGVVCQRLWVGTWFGCRNAIVTERHLPFIVHFYDSANRAIDLRDEFRRQIEQRVPPQTTNPQPGSRSRADADEKLARLRREHAELKESTKVLHSVVLALVQENQRLARRRRRDNADGVALSTPDNTPRPQR